MGKAMIGAAPGCLLVALLAPWLVSGSPADLVALALTAYAASRYCLLPVVLFAIVVTAALRAALPT
ncbi:hypothetical protein D3C80_1976020 [compost metagenome]